MIFKKEKGRPPPPPSQSCLPGIADNEGNFYKEIVAFMVVGLKHSIPVVVQAIAEITVNLQWLAEKISDVIDNLMEIRLCVQIYLPKIIQLIGMRFRADRNIQFRIKYYVKHPQNSSKTYLFSEIFML